MSVHEIFPPASPKDVTQVNNEPISSNSWSALTSSPSPNQKYWASYTSKLDEGAIDWGLTPSEFVELSRLEQKERGKGVHNMIANVTNALREADAELPESEEADHELNFIIVKAEDAELQNRFRRYSTNGAKEEFSKISPLHESFAKHGASNENEGVSAWHELTEKELVRHDVLVFDVSDVLDPENRPGAATISALPIISGDVEKTKKLASAVHGALGRLNELAKQPAVQKVLSEFADNPVQIARLNDGGSSEQRSAPIRMYGEAILSIAFSLALVMADYEGPAKVGQVGAMMAHAHAFERMARSLPSGIVGPFSIRGLTPKGGLLVKGEKGLQIDPKFNDALEERRRKNKQEADMTFGVIALEKGFPEIINKEYDEAEQSGNWSKPTLSIASRNANEQLERAPNMHRGCPAVFVDKDAGSPIEFAATMALKPYMPKRPKI